MTRPPVVADTSPLIMLIGVNHLDLLRHLYEEIVIPRQVLTELNEGAKPSDPDIATFPWISIEAQMVLDSTLPGGLGAGERAVISLASAVGARLVLIDEIRARNVARSKGLRVAGTLAVLLRAKQQRLIPAVRPILDMMLAQGRRFSPQLLADVLRTADEA